MKKSAIYIHIPFCKVKCIYCDFYSITNREKQIPLFTKLLIEEINSYRRYNKKKWEFNTIFFGGGTPSILPVKNILEHMHLRHEFLVTNFFKFRNI